MKKDINRNRGLFFKVGLALSLSLVLVAFEWETPIDFGEPVVLTPSVDTPENEPLPPITVQSKLKPPTPAEQVKDLIPEKIIEVDNGDKVETALVKIVNEPITDATDFGVIEDVEEPEEVVDNAIYNSFDLEQAAAPIGGMDAFYAYVKKNLKYPRQAKRMHVEGKVFVQFVIGKDGSFTDIKVIRGIGAGCDESAIEVMKSAPAWNPAKQRGRAVRQRMTMPIIFKMQ